MSDSPETTSDPRQEDGNRALPPEDLAHALRSFVPGSEPLPTELRTSQRVLARVTDGIYRQPGSALRELISNAYDADATRVTITTDRPRFQRIVITDNGNGMSPEVLQHMLYNIGGSAKRSAVGKQLEVTSQEDSDFSPDGRRLIGKIGIGLFSVAQLTQTFQISTKVKGDDFQCVARVLLRQFSDATTEVDEDGKYKAGKVLVWKEQATDIENHGTTITLTSVRPQTRDALRSTDLWHRIRAAADGQVKKPPVFHIGAVSPDNENLQELINAQYDHLPWDSRADSDEAFHEFAQAPIRAIDVGRRRAQLDNVFDDYLRMIWDLSLAVPLPYVDGHPFDVGSDSGFAFFQISNRASGDPLRLELKPGEILRNALDFELPVNANGFDVNVDELSLKRPVQLMARLETSAALQQPLMFVGHYRTEFPKRAIELSGGPLSFSAYLLWTPRLIPPDHSGVLIRINEASGTLFDPTFLGFPDNEERRLAQITCEVFVQEGLDGALNIDRESFNQTHPHVITLTRWLHQALRQLIATQKKLGRSAATRRRERTDDELSAKVRERVDKVWNDLDLDGSPPTVAFQGRPNESPGDYSPETSYIWPESLLGPIAGRNWRARRAQREEVAAAITQILDAYGVWDTIEPQQQADFLQALYDVVRVHLK